MKISLKDTWYLRAFAFAKIPLLFMASPSVVSLTDEECIIALPFQKRNKNHLGSMYFGALCIGAEITGGMLGNRYLMKVKRGKGNLIFKDFTAKFLKRAEGQTLFKCLDGAKVRDAVTKAEESMERMEVPLTIKAYVPKDFGDEPVAEFTLTMSLKVKRKS
jgi:acyl-coenzyme A thioesterase PaaI-like protein